MVQLIDGGFHDLLDQSEIHQPAPIRIRLSLNRDMDMEPVSMDTVFRLSLPRVAVSGFEVEGLDQADSHFIRNLIGHGRWDNPSYNQPSHFDLDRGRLIAEDLIMTSHSPRLPASGFGTFQSSAIPSTSEKPAEHPALIFVKWPVVLAFAVWAVVIAANFATGRSFRFEFAILLWVTTNILMICSGRGMYQVYLFLLLPCVLTGASDYFNLIGIKVEMIFLIPGINFGVYCLCCALRRNYPERNRLVRKYTLTPQLVLLLLACLLSATQSIYPTQSLRLMGVIFIIPYFYYLYTSHAIQRLANVRQVANVIVAITAFYSAVLGFVQVVNPSHYDRIARNIVVQPLEAIENMWLSVYTESKIVSVWQDSASFGHVLNLSLPIAIGLLLLSKSIRGRLYYGAAVGLIAFGVLVTGNRTDVLGGLASGILIAIGFLAQSRKFRSLFFQGTALTLTLIVIVMCTRETNGLSRLLNPGDWDKATASHRTILMQEGLRMFASSPIFGVGLDNFRFHQDFRQPGVFIVQQYPHNMFVQVLAEVGLFGSVAFALFLGSIFYLARHTWRNRTKTELDFLCFLFFVGSVVLLFQGLMENAIFYIQTSSLFWVFVGIWRGRAMELARPRPRNARDGVPYS